MNFSINEIEALLPGYLSGDISEKDREIIDEWRAESIENEALYVESRKAWEAMALLNEMERFNSFEALKKVSTRIAYSSPSKWWFTLQRVAAILLLPLLLYSGYVSFQNYALNNLPEEQVMMQTVSSRQGMVTQFVMADGTKVWLNSCSELQFPIRFTGKFRQVKLTGEAFFEAFRGCIQGLSFRAGVLSIPKGRPQEYFTLAPEWAGTPLVRVAFWAI